MFFQGWKPYHFPGRYPKRLYAGMRIVETGRPGDKQDVFNEKLFRVKRKSFKGNREKRLQTRQVAYSFITVDRETDRYGGAPT